MESIYSVGDQLLDKFSALMPKEWTNCPNVDLTDEAAAHGRRAKTKQVAKPKPMSLRPEKKQDKKKGCGGGGGAGGGAN